MNKGVFISLLLSILAHALIAAGIALYIDYASVPDELAQLDLTSVDLSFAETPDETAAIASAAPSMPKAEAPRPPETKTKPPPPPEPIEQALPRETEPDTSDLPKPDEPPEQLVTPEPLPQPPEPPVEKPLAPKPEPVVEKPPAPAPQTPAPAVAPRQAKVDAPPKPRRTIKPDYPRESRLRGEQGNVTLEIDVNAQGSVDGVRVVASSNYALLDEAAIRAVRAARFTPAKSDGKSVPSTARLTLNFKLK